MEPDRYEVNHKLFITSMICLMLCICLLIFALYLLPFFLFGWWYDIPAFILHMQEYFTSEQNYSANAANTLIFMIFLLPALITGAIAYFSSQKIENKLYHLDDKVIEDNPERRQKRAADVKESMLFSTKLILIIIMVITIAAIVEWVIYVPPT